MRDIPFNISLALDGNYGALPASRPWRSEDRVLAVPFEFAISPDTLAPMRVGVFAHIFYPELSEDIADALSNIPSAFDLFVSTDTTEKRAEIARRLTSEGMRDVKIEVFPNRGRDIAPLIVGFRDEIRRYDIICHLHSKKSKHDDILFGWREYCYRQLLGSKEIVSSVLFALRSKYVSLIFPDHYGPVLQSLNYGYDYDQIKDILARCGVAFSKDILLEFPSGSMFWARSEVLAPLLSLDLRFDDFPDEEGQIDGTLAHAIERSLAFVAEHARGQWAKIVRPDDCDDKRRLIPVCHPDDLPVAVTRVSRRLLGNRVSASAEPRFIGEIAAVGIRGERSDRPRFTLLIPTLKPEKIFGGVASALRLFNEIVEALPTEVDARIVSVTDDVDADCLAVTGDYVQVSLAADNTELARTLVDASGLKADQLPVRKNEVFLATAWWTAYLGFQIREMQSALYGFAPPLYYLIQDHEPDFYGWSPRYALAQSTYLKPNDTVAIINSEELYNYFQPRYHFLTSYYLPYTVNARLREQFSAMAKERIILVYSRPNTLRNCFEIIAEALCLWQQTNPTIARSWRIIGVGEKFEPWLVQRITNFEIMGKLTLTEYAALLSRSSVGVSLMVSPHPSYPPLEMAEAGLITLTNTHSGKDLRLRSHNIFSIQSLTPGMLASEIGSAVSMAEPMIGKQCVFRPISKIPCDGEQFASEVVARDLQRHLAVT